MSEIKLFSVSGGNAKAIPGETGGLERSLQQLIESNLETLFAVRFIASEHSTGKIHAGRIDTLGIDENGCPVILEYKRAVSENVINQGLYYLDWLMDHKAEFKLLALERYGKTIADAIDWSGPRLICIASDFTKHDQHAVRQINRNIDLVRFRRFGRDLLALELAERTSADSLETDEATAEGKSKQSNDKPVSQMLAEFDGPLRDLYEELRSFILALGDDVTERPLKLYFAFRRIRNFVTVCLNKRGITVYAHVDTSGMTMEKGFTRDVTNIGHWGTGDLEVWIADKAALKKTEPILLRAYEGS